MPDDMDRVQEINEQHLADCLDTHQRRTSEVSISSEICRECGENIPVKRRQAAPGCTRCIDCQTDYETHIHRRNL